MASKRPQTKGSPWVVSSFADFGFSSSPPSDKKVIKRPREPGGHSRRNQKHQRSLQGSSTLWVDLYSPSTRDDLAVHKKKVQEVESWLVESASGVKGRKLLLLTGPSGCGKTATVRVMAREAGLNLLEWTNPTTTPYNNTFMEREDNSWRPDDTVAPVNQTTQFWDFLMRCSKYSSVCSAGKAGNLVCVEDFPNALLRDPPSFHSMLRKYSQRSNGSPLVFIMSDSTQQYGSVKHLFPPDLQQQLSIVNIAFNPIASSLMVKALSCILSVEGASEGGWGHAQPTKEVLSALVEASGGDIRSAINALQFATKKDVGNIEGLFSDSSKKEKPGRRGKKNAKSKSASTEEAHVAVGGKDASLFLFRALGKVLYCKRISDKGVTEPLPKHLKEHERLPLQEVPESIYEKTSMGASSFSLFLHQNYLPFFTDIDSVARAAHYLADSDVLSAYWMDRDVLEGYSTSLTARGLMHPNKGGSSGGGWRPLTRPQWYSVTKQMQQHSAALKLEHCRHSLTMEELVTDLVPLKCKILSGSSYTIQEVGRLSNTRRMHYLERLGELDVTNTITEEEERETATLTALTEPQEAPDSRQAEEDLEDEELTIEDPDED